MLKLLNVSIMSLPLWETILWIKCSLFFQVLKFWRCWKVEGKSLITFGRLSEEEHRGLCLKKYKQAPNLIKKIKDLIILRIKHKTHKNNQNKKMRTDLKMYIMKVIFISMSTNNIIITITMKVKVIKEGWKLIWKWN